MLNIENVNKTLMVLRAMPPEKLKQLRSEIKVIEADRFAHQGLARRAKVSVTFFRSTLLPESIRLVDGVLNEKAS